MAKIKRDDVDDDGVGSDEDYPKKTSEVTEEIEAQNALQLESRKR